MQTSPLRSPSDVSIHSPVKVETKLFQDETYLVFASIHSPVKGETMVKSGISVAIPFQSTRP